MLGALGEETLTPPRLPLDPPKLHLLSEQGRGEQGVVFANRDRALSSPSALHAGVGEWVEESSVPTDQAPDCAFSLCFSQKCLFRCCRWI